MITISRNNYQKILEHAEKHFPEETCGLVAGDIVSCGKVIREVYLLTNVDHSNEHFSMDFKEQFAAIKDMRVKGLKLLGNWHSHSESFSCPSQEDKRLAYDKSASYLILSLVDREHPVLNSFHIEGENVTDEGLVISNFCSKNKKQ